MSKITVKIDPKTGQTYLPREVRNSGFVGVVEAIGSVATLTFIKPNAKLGDIQGSLRLTSSEVALLWGGIASSGTKPDELSSAAAGRHPLFGKYSRDWLSQTLGYSKDYLSRIATGRVHLSKPFKERACYKLGELEADFFAPEEEINQEGE